MNTHLHIIEPYTNLLRVWRDPLLERQTRNLLNLFLHTILNPVTHHLDLFFDEQWQGKRNIQSFGHDIEASWLLHETALVLGDAALTAQVEQAIRPLARAAGEGLCDDGAMVYEKWTDTGVVNENRDWWVQCECIIGHIDLYQYFGDLEALDIARRCWDFTCRHLVDHEGGEWHWGVKPDGTLNLDDDKAGFWKCPYHNARLCLEIIEREMIS
jgi:mannobiose 2-epimerase